MRASKRRQGLLASAFLVIVLAIATFFSTELKAGQLRSYLDASTNNYYASSPIKNSVDLRVRAGGYGSSSRSADNESIVLQREEQEQGPPPHHRDGQQHGGETSGDDGGFHPRVRGGSSRVEAIDRSNNSHDGPIVVKDSNSGDQGRSEVDDNDNERSHTKVEQFVSDGTISESENTEEAADDGDGDGDGDDDGDDDDDEVIDEFDDVVDIEFDEDEEAIDEGDDDEVFDDNMSSRMIGNGTRNNVTVDTVGGAKTSPVCNPHFNLALPNGQWSNATKFKRIYFYHARKAGGSSMHKYLAKVSLQYGLELKATEWHAMEEPGTYDDDATFYVTHLREPVSRSLSHFKYEGRWGCRDLVYARKTFIPTEANANKLETWNQTGGHEPFKCKMRGSKKTGGKRPHFFMGKCAVNCYVQWFSGLSCEQWDISLEQQYQVAKARVLRYNFVAVIEKLTDPAYVQAVENFFGVPGLTEKGSPFCERQSHEANANVPLVVHNDTRERLKTLNAVDRKLYHELSGCLASSPLDFPKWDGNRFELHSYNLIEAKAAMKKAKAAKEIKIKTALKRAKAEKRKTKKTAQSKNQRKQI